MRSEFLDRGAPSCQQLFHVKHSDRRSIDSCQSVRSGYVAQFVRHVPCIPVPMRKRSNRADAKMKADLRRWLIESGEAEELVAFLREERVPHPAPPPRMAVTTSLNVDIFDAMMARAASEGITSRSGALRAAVCEWVSDVECQSEHTRIDEAVARPRVTSDEWGAGCSTRIELRPRVHIRL